MEKSEQERFRPAIDRRLAEIADELAAVKPDTETIAPDTAVGRLSRMDSIQMQQMAMAQRQRLEDEASRLREARARIDAGEYGRCQLCGHEIAVERLEYQPDAVVCVPCAQKRK